MRNLTPSKSMNARRIAGVTLMELMVVIVVLGVLVSIGVPSYREYMRRTHRTEAKSALLRLAAQQERFYLQNNTYTNNFVALGFTGPVSENSVYDLSIPLANATAFTINAVPRPGGGTNGVTQMNDAECMSFTINHLGVRTAAPNPDNRCW